MPVSFSGSCLCGAVRFEATGTPRFQGFCHCPPCRKASSGHSAAITMEQTDVRIIGECASFTRYGDSGGRVVRHFCPVCGVGVFHSYPDADVVLSLNAALLDQPDAFKPEIAIHTRSALPWDVIDPALPRCETAPAAQQR